MAPPGNDGLYNLINKGIIEERYGTFLKNVRKNRPLIQKFGGLSRIVPLLQNRHVIIAGAGPSLDEAANLLKKCSRRHEVVIIAADMAFRPLVERGIPPSFVISCETRPMDFFNGVSAPGCHLLAFSCISPSNLKSWKGDISFYNWMMESEHYDILWETAGKELGSVATASTVVTNAVSIALGCTVRSLALVGNDMGFSHYYHCRGSMTARRDLLFSMRKAPPETLEYGTVMRSKEYMIQREGGVFYTNGQFLAAKKWLEGLFDSGNYPVYDLSDPGCSPRYTRKVSFNDYCRDISPPARKKRKRRK